MNDLPDVVRKLSAEIRSHYLLGYSPANDVSDGKYRKLTVELLQPPGSSGLRAYGGGAITETSGSGDQANIGSGDNLAGLYRWP